MNASAEQAADRLVQLINAERDGDLDAAGRTELAALLESSSEARAVRSEWQRVFNLLDSLPDEEPPVAIANRVVDAAGPVPWRRAAPWRGLFSLRRLAPAGLGFATGLLLTVAAYEVVAPASFSGMHNAVGTAGIVQRQETLTSASLPGPFVDGEIVLRATPVGLILEVDVEGESDFTIGMDHPGFVLQGLVFDDRSRAADPSAADVAPESLAVSGKGRQAFSVFLSRAAAQAGGVSVHVTTDEKTVYSGVLGG